MPTKKVSIITTRPRVMKICNIYNISFETLLAFLIQKGYGKIEPNELLDERVLALIKNEFNSDKIQKDNIRGKTNLHFIKPKAREKPFDLKIEYLNNSVVNQIFEPKILLKNDLFNGEQIEINYKNFETIKSFFSDNDAIKLCKKMNSSYARSLSNRYQMPKENIPLIRYQIHYIANKALNIFGSKIITFILGLRNLKFKNTSALEIRNYQKVIPDFPIITLVTKEKTPFKISFFVKKSNKENKLKGDVRLFNSKTNSQIAYIDEKGYIFSKLNKFNPELSLFYEATTNNIFTIYAGIESGNCTICGRELTDPFSLRIGVGPSCAKQIGIDFSLYTFN
jgi:hypothetical protein